MVRSTTKWYIPFAVLHRQFPDRRLRGPRPEQCDLLPASLRSRGHRSRGAIRVRAPQCSGGAIRARGSQGSSVASCVRDRLRSGGALRGSRRTRLRLRCSSGPILRRLAEAEVDGYPC